MRSFARALRMEKTFAGDLARIEVPDLLTFLNLSQRTGQLLMERAEQQASIYFRGGRPIFASANKEGLRLPDMLVRLGKLKAEQVQRIVERHRAVGHRIGQILIAEKILTEQELITYLKVQVSEVVFDTFEWHSGSFAFYDDVAPPDHAVTLQMDVQNLIMEGVRRIDVRGRLAGAFPDRGRVVVSVTGAERVKRSLTLTPEEWQVFFLVDGRRSLAELCQIAGNPDELATLEVLHRLVEANLIAVAPPAAASAEPEAAAPVEPTVRRAPGVPTGDVAVELRPSATARPPDDSSKIVSEKAVPYVEYSEPSAGLVMGRLVLVRAGQEISFPLTGDSHVVGRHASNDITVDDPKVSAFHARIDRLRLGFVLVDLKSTNGTFLNSERISAAVLKPGDEIWLGPARLRFKLDYASGIAAPSPDPPPGSGPRR